MITGKGMGKLSLMIKRWFGSRITTSRLLLSFLVLAAALTGCFNRDPLLGKWQEPDSGVMMELMEDGTLVMSLGNSSFSMKYTVEDPDKITLIASSDSNIPDTVMTYKLEDDRLILTLDGVATVFTRVD